MRDINPSDEVIQNWVNDNVPELNETEDERVSKDIIHFLEENKKLICFYHKNSLLDSWIDWIRKQCNKEVNKETTETYSEWDKEDKLHLTNAIIAAQSVWGNDSRTYNWLESLKNRVFPKTKCDWSEEDEKMLDKLGHLIFRVDYCDSRAELSNWLYHLKNRVQSKQEWSEEDEENRKSIIGLLEGWLNTFKETGYAEDCMRGVKWLKSIRPQNQWKPTVEQMNGISTVLARYKMSPQLTKVIESLYFDLKKHYTKKT